jgi:hypothetical protein
MSFMARFQAGVVLVLLAGALWGQDKTAQDKNQASASSSRSNAHAKVSPPEAGAISNGVYHNATFGFSYKLPFGWVDRTADMQDDSAEAGKSRLLLAIFERPPAATGDTVNSAVVIAAEPRLAGMKTAEEYLDSLAAIATTKGFQAEGETHEFSLAPAKLVRADFSKARGALTMRQASLVTVEKGYAVSFTFIGGSEDEVNQLIERLSFAMRKR